MRFVAAFFALLAFVACASEEPTPEKLQGTVTNLSVEEGAVTGFDLVTDDEIFPIVIDPERDYGFDLLHLEEHESTGDPVIVETEIDGDDVVAVTIEDA